MKKRTLSAKGQQLVADLLIELGLHLTTGNVTLHIDEARVKKVHVGLDFSVTTQGAQ